MEHEAKVKDMVLIIERAVYGAKDTPKDRREYTIPLTGSGAVGSVDEIRDWIRANGLQFNKLHIKDSVNPEDDDEIVDVN
jgi:hypothetical protein